MSLQPVTRTVTITSAGTAVSILPKATVIQSGIVKVVIQAGANTVYVGDSNALASTTVGIKLTTGQVLIIDGVDNVLDLGKIFVDSATSSTTVNVLYFQRV